MLAAFAKMGTIVDLVQDRSERVQIVSWVYVIVTRTMTLIDGDFRFGSSPEARSNIKVTSVSVRYEGIQHDSRSLRLYGKSGWRLMRPWGRARWIVSWCFPGAAVERQHWNHTIRCELDGDDTGGVWSVEDREWLGVFMTRNMDGIQKFGGRVDVEVWKRSLGMRPGV